MACLKTIQAREVERALDSQMDDTRTKCSLLGSFDSHSTPSDSQSIISSVGQNSNTSLLGRALNSIRSPVSTPNQTTPLKWQFGSKEFIFQSNSTPSKREEHPRKRLVKARQRRSQLMGAKSRVPSRLHQSTSKLDLLENDKLTSLPIPPPRANLDESNASLGLVSHKRLKVNPVTTIHIHSQDHNRKISYRTPFQIDNKENYKPDTQSSDQIVFVEDYIEDMHDSTMSHLSKKKVSLSDLRAKMGHRKDKHIPLRSKKSQARISVQDALHNHLGDKGADDNIQGKVHSILQTLQTNELSQNKDRYLSEIIGEQTAKVRSCVVCEKPLYEVSSLMLQGREYKEIVCGDCASRYEGIAQLFEDCEFESSVEEDNDNNQEEYQNNSSRNSIDDTFDSAIALYENSAVFNSRHQTAGLDISRKLNKPLLTTNSRFSEELINKLQSHLKKAQKNPDKAGLDGSKIAWFLEARRKIKWEQLLHKVGTNY